MIFVIDQQLPRRLAEWIRAQGHEALHVRDLGLEHADDQTIWREAKARGAVIITKDEDFSGMARSQPAIRVLWVRLGNSSNDALISRMQTEWENIVSALSAGALLIELR